MPKSTRYRQLRRVAERRAAEKRDMAAVRRQRLNRIAIALGSVVLIVGLVAVGGSVLGGDSGSQASDSPTPSVSESPQTDEGRRTGWSEVDTELVKATNAVACGGVQPEKVRAPRPQFAAPAQVLEPGREYYAHIDTSCGEIVVRLLADRAPQAVNSFVFLAQDRYFDGLRFHRIAASIDVIQGGDPTGVGAGGPGYSFPDELDGTETYGPGVVAMANSGADTNGSQFFIVFGPNGHLLDSNPAYTIFGEVVSGLDVAKAIGAIPVLGETATNPAWAEQPSQTVWINSIEITDQP